MGRAEETPSVTRIEFVFFDVGETLLRPYPSFPDLFARTCRAEGFAVEARDVERVQERLAPHLIDLAAESGVATPSLSPEASRAYWTYLYARLLGELGLPGDDLIGPLYEVFSNAASYRLFDDVMPALDELTDAGYRLGVISNFEEWLEKLLVDLEVGDAFEVTVISGMEGIEKPDRAMYERAVERAGVAPSRCLHVGDSPAMDVAPAQAAGLHAVLLDRRGRYVDRDLPSIASLEDLSRFVTNL